MPYRKNAYKPPKKVKLGRHWPYWYEFIFWGAAVSLIIQIPAAIYLVSSW